MILQGRVAVVAGAGSEIADAYGSRLSALGASVTMVYWGFQKAAQSGCLSSPLVVDLSSATLGSKAISIRATLKTEEDARRVFEIVRGKLGRLDILVNHIEPGTRLGDDVQGVAGAIDRRTLAFDEDLNRLISCCRAGIRLMQAESAGVIVNSAIAPRRDESGFGIAGAVVSRFTGDLAAELAPFGIRANCIFVDLLLKRWRRSTCIDAITRVTSVPQCDGGPSDCADVMEFLVSDLSRCVTGQCVHVGSAAGATA